MTPFIHIIVKLEYLINFLLCVGLNDIHSQLCVCCPSVEIHVNQYIMQECILQHLPSIVMKDISQKKGAKKTPKAKFSFHDLSSKK
jgi:hypothetical protein